MALGKIDADSPQTLYSKYLSKEEIHAMNLTMRPRQKYWRQWILPPLIDFDVSGDSVYASSSQNTVNATLTTNPHGYSPNVDAAIQGIDASRYPLPEMRLLSRSIAKHLGLSPDEVLLGAGIDGLIAEIVRSIFSKNDRLIMPTVTFPNAAFITRICGGTVDFSDMKNETFYDLDALRNLNTTMTKATYIANPNNPTGQVLEAKELLSNLYYDNSILIVDEANIEFGGESCVNYVNEYPNLIVLRTFSKGYGLAGLRVGYACGNPELLRLIDRSRPPFPVSNIACLAAIAALEDQEYLSKSVSYIQRERARLIDALLERDFRICEGSANSILCRRASSEADLARTFDEVGMTVASGQVFGLPDYWCRIAPQKPSENDQMIAIIESL